MLNQLQVNEDQVQELTEKELRRLELQQEFNYDGFQVVRKELFAHLRDPAMVVRYDSITFNTACIGGLEGAVYVNLLINEDNKRIVVRRCGENDVDALRWCIAKPECRKSRAIKCREFSKRLYSMMEWNPNLRYKIMACKIEHDGEELYVFDLTHPELHVQPPRKKKSEDANEIQRQEYQAALLADPSIPNDERILSGRQGFLPETDEAKFGMSVEEHAKAHEVTELNGLTSMAILTGNIHRDAGGSDGQQ